MPSALLMSTLSNMRWWDRLNRALYPYMGPAQLGVAGEPPRIVDRDRQPCPLCGAPMAGHVVERSGGNVATRLHCPV